MEAQEESRLLVWLERYWELGEGNKVENIMGNKLKDMSCISNDEI